MKNRLLFLWISILFGTFLFGQEKLKVTYEEVSDLEVLRELGIEISGRTFHLIVANEESDYSSIEKINNSQNLSGNRIIDLPKSAIYKNTKELFSLQSDKIGNENYLVQDSLTQFNWELTREAKTILGFPVRKAMTTNKNAMVTAWFSPQLKFNTGPDQFWGLPGLILEIESRVNVDDKESVRAFIAVEVEVISDSQKLRPSNGKLISKEKFNEKVKVYREKRDEMYSGGLDSD